MIDFKDGAFLIAIQTHTPILPMIFVNTDTILPNNPPMMRPGFIDIYYLDPIDVSGLAEEHLPELKIRVKQLMLDKYTEVTQHKN